jgi:hypothetical protein
MIREDEIIGTYRMHERIRNAYKPVAENLGRN